MGVGVGVAEIKQQPEYIRVEKKPTLIDPYDWSAQKGPVIPTEADPD